jgi:ubiquinone/menaquinone biosynthesis C-methylase UbiE
VSLAPFVPSPPEVIQKMLEVADVSRDDTVFDLGSGNGAVIITAAKDFGAKCVGIEMRRDLVEKAEEDAKKYLVDGMIKFLNANLFDVDISGADVVTLYLTSSGNKKLKSKLENELRDKSRIVSHDFEISGWTPCKILRGSPPGHTIYLYIKGF